MTHNPIQFWAGLSLPALLARYGTEQQCRDALLRFAGPKALRALSAQIQPSPSCRVGSTQCHRCRHYLALFTSID